MTLLETVAHIVKSPMTYLGVAAVVTPFVGVLPADLAPYVKAAAEAATSIALLRMDPTRFLRKVEPSVP